MNSAQRTAGPVLAVEDLAIGYRHRTVGEGIGFTVDAGEVLCLLGPNGSGKTTLFRTLLGVLPPVRGQVRIAGRPLATWPRRELARQLAYVPQSQAMPFAYTVEALVLMGRAGHLAPFARPAEADRQIARRALAVLGIEHLADRACPEVSGGERQLALIARALAQQAAVLVLDEPTASLDFGNQLRVLEQIRALRATGIAVVMATHQPEHALRVADRMVFLKHGRIVRQGGPEIAGARALAQLYDTDEALVAAGLPARAGILCAR